MNRANMVFASIFVLVVFTGCGVPKAEVEQLRAENESLRQQVDEFKNGESRLIAIIDKAYAEKNYTVVKDNIQLLAAKHPDSPKNIDYKVMLAEVSRSELVAGEAAAAAEKERLRIQNLDNMGIWRISYYVDNFGERTKNRFIANSEHLAGRFSNTATQDSRLNVDFLIDGPASISIQLYEYAGRNPVKATSAKRYAVGVKDKDGDKYNLYATNTSDRLTLADGDAKSLHSVLLKGGQVQFWIQELDRPTDQYQFTISNADGYDNAFQKFGMP